ncbi:hypothetical protein [Streptomyces tibetensis]|uniref:hypothetical protein n=1 Tax=Streptomyces tibetensis TaxID=2382123 RepID=UPI0033C729B2
MSSLSARRLMAVHLALVARVIVVHMTVRDRTGATAPQDRVGFREQLTAIDSEADGSRLITTPARPPAPSPCR